MGKHVRVYMFMLYEQRTAQVSAISPQCRSLLNGYRHLNLPLAQVANLSLTTQ